MPEFHSASQQLLNAFLGRRRGNAVGAVVPKNEDLRFSFCENELSTYSVLPIHAEGHAGGKGQAQTASLEFCSVSLDLGLVGLSSIVESRATGDRNANRTPDAAYAAIKM